MKWIRDTDTSEAFGPALSDPFLLQAIQCLEQGFIRSNARGEEKHRTRVYSKLLKARCAPDLVPATNSPGASCLVDLLKAIGGQFQQFAQSRFTDALMVAQQVIAQDCWRVQGEREGEVLRLQRRI